MMQVQEANKGVSFRTDLSAVGSGRSSKIFASAASSNVLNEERRLIDKVFSIIDKDNNQAVDIDELKGMFRLFDVEAAFLDSAINRIMQNVDKDLDYTISPQEFYQLLSQKFSDEDPETEMEAVFNRMNKKRDGKLSVDELHEVSTMLGESLPKSEIKDMIKSMNEDHCADYKKEMQQIRKNPSSKNKTVEPSSRFSEHVDLVTFKNVMKQKL